MTMRRTPVLVLLLAINAVNFFDRQILAAVTEPLRLEWGLTDTQIGWLGTAFTLLYAVAGLPLGRLADVWRRTWLMAIGLGLWSGLTFVSGLCRGFWSLFAARLGVGIGEASCAPAATSLIGDLFPASERARALSVFMLGLPVGLSLSYIVGGAVAQHYGWRYAFFIAGIPGFVLALLVLRVREPARLSPRHSGSPFLIVLGIPTMWAIIVSGALHNFNLYGISSFLPAYLARYHHLSVQAAGFYSAVVVGVMGGAGMLLGGWLGDAAVKLRENGRMLAAATALLLAAPIAWLALMVPRGAATAFMVLLGCSYMLMYVYYAAIYAAIQDIVAPALRGTAMAVYFLAMYLLGASLGPVGTGGLSDYLARRAAGGALPVPEEFRALGLHQAMHMVPAVALVIATVLFVGAALIRKDLRRSRGQ